MKKTLDVISEFISTHRSGATGTHPLDLWRPGIETQFISESLPPARLSPEPKGKITGKYLARVSRMGVSGWNYEKGTAEFVTFEFDSEHKHKGGLTDAELRRVESALMNDPRVMLRRSTSGSGLHAVVRLDSPHVADRKEFIALSNFVAKGICADWGIPESWIDGCGGILWVWTSDPTPQSFESLAHADAVYSPPHSWRESSPAPAKRIPYSGEPTIWSSYNDAPRVSIAELLTESGGTETSPGRWRSPSTDKDSSASVLTGAGIDIFYAHTPNWPPFEAERKYLPVEVLNLVRHGGDWSATRKDLADWGYEDPLQDSVDEFSIILPDMGQSPYPIDVFPQLFRDYFHDAARGLNVDPGQIALPFLVSAAGVVGNRRWVGITDDWKSPLTLWSGIVANPGAKKTPIVKQSFRFAQKVDDVLYENYLKIKNLPDGKQSKDEAPNLFLDNATTEALTWTLFHSPMGLLVRTGELAGWHASIDQYKPEGGGTGRAVWLQCFDADKIKESRKSGVPPHMMVPRPNVSIFGGVQPKVLRRTIYAAGHEDGMFQRFLFSMPERRPPQRMSRNSVKSDTLDQIQDVFWKLHGMNVLEGVEPVVMPLSKNAFEIFADYKYNLEVETAERLENGEWSESFINHVDKLDLYVARIACLLELLFWSVGEGSDVEVSEGAVEKAIHLVNWHKQESFRIYEYLKKVSNACKKEGPDKK